MKCLGRSSTGYIVVPKAVGGVETENGRHWRTRRGFGVG
jgi:hypothetical protein